MPNGKSPLAPQAFPDLPPVNGIKMATAAAGIKYKNRVDLLLVDLPESATVAGVFTQSKTRSSAVDWCRSVLADDRVTPRGILVNSGNANAFTGAKGQTAVQVSTGLAAKALGCRADQILPASTGVIGEVLPTEPIATALARMKPDGSAAALRAAADAILTTDTFAKGASERVGNATISGIAKGSGMIAPDMATMLAFVFTDAKIEKHTLQAMLQRATHKSFNAITVDSDTSTSDTLLVAATGEHPVAEDAFEAGLTAVLTDLAHQIVRDGEGASKFIEIEVTGAVSDQEAKTVAMSIANSPLVKTAIAGEDANWGRIVMAVGKSGAHADRDRMSIAVGDVTIAEQGGAVAAYDEAPVTQHMQGTEIKIRVDLNLADGAATVWTCDLTHGYISINADYRS